MLLFLSITGVFLSILLIYFNRKKNPGSVFLGLYFLLISLYGFIQYTMVYSHSTFLISIVFIHAGFPTYLIGPAFFFYFRSILTDKIKLSKKDLWHLTPMIVYLIMAIPYFLMPWSYKTELAGRIAHDLNYPTHIEFFPLFSAQIKGMVFFTRPLLVLGYLIWSWIIFRKYLSSQPDSGIFASQRFMKTWLAILMTSTFILVVSHLTMILIALEGRNIVIFLTINALQISSVIGLTGLLISPFFFPHILYGLPRIPEKILEKNIIAQEEQLVQKVIQPGKHAYETEYLQLIQIKTETCMDEHQPYLNEECNLVSFAKLIDIPAHHLSYYFREISRQPFNEFRNGWRIKHAKKLMQDGKHAELTLEGVGKLSGFASRITFIRAFKKVEGITPGEFASKLKT